MSACHSASAGWQLAVNTFSSLIIREVTSQRLSLISYTDDFGDVTSTEATSHFNSLHTLLGCLSLQEATHKAHPPSQIMTWLGLRCDTINMTVTIPEEKMADTMHLVNSWSHKSHTNIHELRAVLGKLFYIAQCCPPARFFVNRVSDTLRACPLTGSVPLSQGFQKDGAWFRAYLPHCNDIYIILKEDRTPIQL